MISKKMAAALGGGAVAAAGAGALGVKLLGEGKEENKAVAGGEKTATALTADKSFSTTSESDEMAVASAEKWESRSSGLGLVLIEIKEGSEVKWQCTLKPIFIGYGPNSKIETLRQWQEAEVGVKSDPIKREKFVKNCSGSRTSKEKSDGKTSTIELEAVKENNTWKFKNLERLWTEDYGGLRRLEGDDLWAYSMKKDRNNSSNWKMEEEVRTGKEKKLKISLTSLDKSKEWSCSISGTYEDELTSKTFKRKGLEDILKADTMNVGESEKRKYLVRNCVKHKKDIKGLTVRGTKDGKWEFGDLKKITEGMYENPNAN